MDLDSGHHFPVHSHSGSAGFTVDIFVGLGIGYSFVSERYPDKSEVYKEYFKENRTSRMTVPIRLGVNFGYALNRLKR